MAKKVIAFTCVGILLTATTVFAVPVIVFAVLPVPRTAKATVSISLRDAQGQPLRGTEVQLWGYQQNSRDAVTDDQGLAVFNAESASYSTSVFSPWRRRPSVFELRVQVPEQSELYYRFEISRSGPTEYQIFDDSYDYYFGEHWLGTFNEYGQIADQTRHAGRVYVAKAANDVAAPIQLWKAQATVGNCGDGTNLWKLRLDLQASKTLP